MRRITRSTCERLRQLRSQQGVFVNFPFIALRNSIPPGPPTPDPTIPPPPPQPELPPEEPKNRHIPTHLLPLLSYHLSLHSILPNHNHNPRQPHDTGYLVTHK